MLRRPAFWLVDRFRRSLQWRVVVATSVLSLVVVSLVGVVLLDQVARGLVKTHRISALAEAGSGLQYAQATVAALPGGLDQTRVDAELESLTQQLANRGGQAGAYDVVLVRTNSDEGWASCCDADVEEVPDALRERVAASAVLARTYTRVIRAGESEPALVVGAPLGAGAGRYELHYIFPLRNEMQTLSLVRRTVLGGGVALVLLVAGVAALVARQVVTPVRLAARTAERFAEGLLDSRMVVEGQDELARLGDAFNEMATSLQQKIRQLQDLSRLQQRFVSDVSHELRTPLTTVRMAADLLHAARADFPPEVARSAELLQAELDRFESLLADLLEISRFDAGAAALDAEVVSLPALVRHVVDALAPLAARRGSEIVVKAPPDEAVLVDADPRRLERVIRNLLANAVEHGEGLPVDVRIAADDAAVALTVRDRGQGLRPGEASRVFNRFWRADPARARHTAGGTGLGLAIAWEDTRLHGGWLQATGAPGQGAMFRLTLPRRAGTELDHSPLPLELPVSVPYA